MKHISLFEQFTAIAVELVNEKREDVGKYNTVKKVIAKIGKRPSEQDLAQFITDNYYDVTEVEQGNDDERANDKIADLVGFLKYDIKDWNAAWNDAQNESVLHEANKGKVHKAAKQGSYPAVIVVVKDGKVIHQEPVSTPEVAPATFNVMQEKYPKALIHLEDKTGKRLFSESVVTGFTEAKMTKDKLENLIYSLENENDSWHPSSDSKKKSMLDKLKKDLSKFESVVTEEVAYNSSNTKPEAAKQATKEFGKLLPKANKGVEPYVFAVIKTKARNYRLAIKSGSYVAHEFMSGLRKDGILTADIVKKAVANVIKLNPEEFNESVVNEALASGSKIEKNLNKALKSNINMFGDNDETIKVLDTPVRIERSQYDKEMNGRSKNFEASIMYMYGSVTNEYHTSAVIGLISRTKGTAKVFLYSEETYGKFAKGASFKEYEGASVLAEFQNKTRDVVSHLSKFPADGSANESIVTEKVEKIACLECDEVNTKKAWNKNNGFCPSCKDSSKGVAESVVTEARPGTKTYYHDRDVLPPHYGNSELHDKSEEMFKKSWKKLNDKQKDEVLSSFPKNESVVTEAKNTIGLAFKEEQDYLDFKEFVAEQPRGAIRKNIGFDSKTKSWNVEMDVKVLDSIYGEGTPSDKKSGWYGGLPDDFESVIIESVVTEGKMPNKLINDDDIVFLKTSENSKGAHYNVYYKGYDIDFGGVGFGTEKQLNSYAKEYILSRQWANKLRWEDAKPLPESVVTEARNYKESPDGKHKVKATVCYIKPMSGKRECKAIYFKSKHDALGFKDNVKGFPKGAAVEAIKESNMKYTILFEEFIKKTKSVSSQNEAVKVTPESDVKIDDYTTDNGEEIKAVEIVGAISSSETEDEFLDYFYDAYGQGAFTETDTSTLVKYFNDFLEEITAKETEEEEAEKDGGGEEEDPLADLDI